MCCRLRISFYRQKQADFAGDIGKNIQEQVESIPLIGASLSKNLQLDELSEALRAKSLLMTQKEALTKEQIKELVKCREDPKYFIETYCQIVTLDKGLQPFKLYECQKRKVDFIMENRQTILMEGRQQGKTITSAACILHYTLFQTNKTVAILANK